MAAYRDFLAVIAMSHSLYVHPPPTSADRTGNMPFYRAFIGKGNNSQLVRALIKQRWWWSLRDDL